MQETQETWVRSLGPEDPLEKEMASHSGVLAWRIPWTEEPRGLQSVKSQAVGYNWARMHNSALPGLFMWLYFITGEGNGSPLQYSCLENPMDRGAWQAMVHRVLKSRTQLKQLSMHTLWCISMFLYEEFFHISLIKILLELSFLYCESWFNLFLLLFLTCN